MTIKLSWCHVRAIKWIDRHNRRDNNFVIFLLFSKRKKLNGIVLECINPFCIYAALQQLLFHGVSPKLVERRCRTRRKHFIGETSGAFNVTIVFLTVQAANLGREVFLELPTDFAKWDLSFGGIMSWSSGSYFSLGKLANEFTMSLPKVAINLASHRTLHVCMYALVVLVGFTQLTDTN